MNRWFKDECPSKIWEQTKIYVRRNKKTKSACLLGWACTIYVNPQSAPIDRLICLFFCFFLHKTLSISKFCIIYAFIFLVSFFVHIFFQSGPCLCVGPERLVEEPRALCSLHASNACLGLSYAAGLTVSPSPSKHARGPCWPRSVRPKILPTFRKSYLSSILR